jgi:hypothetical protein
MQPYLSLLRPTPIYYAPPLPWYRGDRTQRTIIRLLIFAAITCAAIWAFRLVQQLHFLYQQHQWMQYTMPLDKVVLADGTPDVPQLLKLPGYHPIAGGAAAFRAPRWTCKRSDLSYPFIHARGTAGQPTRLVSVVAVPNYDQGGGRRLGLFAYAEIPASLNPGSRPVDACAIHGPDSGDLLLPVQSSIRIFAGQPDPADQSHFTIRFEHDGKSNVIDGWLMPDDTIKLEPR